MSIDVRHAQMLNAIRPKAQRITPDQATPSEPPAARPWAAARQAANQARRARYDAVDPTARGYRGPTVCRVVGITYRQLDYWATTGLVEPSVRDAIGSGTQRLYSLDDIVTLQIIKRLLDVGVSLQRIRRTIDHVRSLHLRFSGMRDAVLASDGEQVYVSRDPSGFGDLLGSGHGIFAVAVEPVYAEMQQAVAALPAKPAGSSDDDQSGRAA